VTQFESGKCEKEDKIHNGHSEFLKSDGRRKFLTE
jgi:hypothetical protein